MSSIENIIDEAFEQRAQISPQQASSELKSAVAQAIQLLDSGDARVAENDGETWIVNEWLKKAVLLSFRLEDNQVMQSGCLSFYDKVASKFGDYDKKSFKDSGFRVVPPAAVRKGAYIGPNVVLMPSYVNIGAYVGPGTMVDTSSLIFSILLIFAGTAIEIKASPAKMSSIENIIDEAFEQRAQISPQQASSELKSAVAQAIQLLDSGDARVAENDGETWIVNEWLKKAVLLSFRLEDNQVMQSGCLSFYDKVASKFGDYDKKSFKDSGFRVVPPAAVRKGAYIGPNVVLMPSYVNIGAYVGPGTMVDTWATVGSCAQIGKNVHLSGGVGIGGVLEPLQASPTIIEDNCFIGARSEIVEGVIVGAGSVISMGVYIDQSTKIYDRGSGEVFYGRVPAGSVVVSGSLPAADASHSLYCAVIVKQVDQKTRAKVSINELLRED